MGKLRPKRVKKTSQGPTAGKLSEAKYAFKSACLQSFAYQFKSHSFEICINSTVAYVTWFWEQVQVSPILYEILGFF